MTRQPGSQATRQPGSHDTLIQHLASFDQLELLVVRVGKRVNEPPPGADLITPQGIQEKALRVMLVRDTLVSRLSEEWTLAIRIARAGNSWLPVRSRREALRN